MIVPAYATYGATKNFNLVFANLIACQLDSCYGTKGLVDGLVLQPGMVSSGMNNYKTIDNVSCTTDECTRGTLSDLGNKPQTYGSLLHNF